MKMKILGIFVCLLLINAASYAVFGVPTHIESTGVHWSDHWISQYLTIFRSSDSLNWTEQAKLIASDGNSVDWFGASVSIDGEYAVVGAEGDDALTGSAYIFKRDGSSWTEQAKLIASDGASWDRFGTSVSIDEDYVIVGAFGDDDSGSDSGSVYVFKRNGTWTEEVKLIASDGTAGDLFGFSVSINGNYAVVGARGDEDDAGSAYIFKRTGATWSQEAKLIAPDGAPDSYFGNSVSINGGYAIIGAEYDDNGNGFRAGSAYVFKRDGTSWAEEAKLIASDGNPQDFFGQSVDLSGEYAVVGADGYGGLTGSVYVFKRNGTWTEEVKLIASDGTAGDLFGFSVSICDENVLVGAMWDEDDTGAVYAYERTDTGWIEEAKLTASDGAVDDWFGCSVSIDENIGMIGARQNTNSNGNRAGAVYVFEKPLPPPPLPDLDCEGDLSWVNVTPGDTVTGSFEVSNIGEPSSLLDWDISITPSWGEWTFDPESGESLTPEDGLVVVNVSVVAPDKQNEEFSGSIRIVNKENSSDYCKIYVSLSTPRNKAFNINLPFQRVLEQTPIRVSSTKASILSVFIFASPINLVFNG